MINTRLFEGKEYPLIIYNEKAVVDMAFRFYSEEICDGTETEFDFPNYTSSYLRIYDERLGRLIKELALSQTSSLLIANFSVLDMTFEDNGNYYYEMGYVMGVYEQPLRYGQLTVL